MHLWPVNKDLVGSSEVSKVLNPVRHCDRSAVSGQKGVGGLEINFSEEWLACCILLNKRTFSNCFNADADIIFGKKKQKNILQRVFVLLSFSNTAWRNVSSLPPLLFSISCDVNKRQRQNWVSPFFAPHDTSVCCLCKDPAAVVGVLCGELFKAPAGFESSCHLWGNRCC